MRLRLLAYLPILALAACPGLSDMSATLADLQALQQGLSTALGEPGVGVNHSSGGVLTVTLVNSRLAAAPEGERAAKARGIGEFVRDHYPRYGGLQRVAVAFSTQAGAGGVSMSRTHTPYIFTTQDLGPAPAPSDSSSSGGPPATAQ